MAKAFGPQIKKLQKAINEKFDAKILLNKTQYYSKDSDRPLELLVVKRAIWDDEKQKFKNVELFSSASDIQIVLYLRDMWYELNEWEVPTDNEEWNKAKEAYQRKHEVNNGKRSKAVDNR